DCAVRIRRSRVGSKTKRTLANAVKAVYVADRRSGNGLSLQSCISGACWRSGHEQTNRLIAMSFFLHLNAGHVAERNGFGMIAFGPLSSVIGKRCYSGEQEKTGTYKTRKAQRRTHHSQFLYFFLAQASMRSQDQKSFSEVNGKKGPTC